MAIIYSYPESLQVLATDLLLGTSTIMVAGKKKNITKNFTVETLGLFIQDNYPTATPNLNQVLTAGNTSLLSAKVQQLGLFDNSEGDYGLLTLSSNTFEVTEALGNTIFNIDNASFKMFKTSGGPYANIFFTGVANRNYQLPDASGTIALTSDIPTKTSDLINDGEDGINPFITAADIPVGTQDLDSVLTIGNTSQLTAKVGELGLFDSDTADYGYLSLNSNQFEATDTTGDTIFSVYNASFKMYAIGGGPYANIFFAGGANRDYQLPDQSGTIALLPGGTVSQYIRGDFSLATFPTIPTVTPSALTGVNDTNVTLTLGGTPSTALLQGVSLTLGWTGTLADSRISSATNWNTAYNNRITSLTTTGSGAATLISNVLNIPTPPAATFTSLTTTGSSGSSTLISGVLNVPTYTLSGLGGVSTSRTLTINGTTYDLTADRTWSVGTVTSIGMTVPSAFNVTPSTITSSGTFAITGAGLTSQYVRGDGTLANFPISTGGGASVSYYLNGSVSQGTIGGVAYKEMNGIPVIGAGTDFSINADGYIAQFITDAGDPNKLLIPAGNWNFETYFSASSGGGSPRFYIELYKYDGTTFTLIATNSATPEYITGGTSIDLYFTALAVPATALLVTDRLAVRFYVIHSGRTITMHTENSHLSQIITTFSSGLTALNGLTSQVQYFAVGTSGTDFNINSLVDTHTFNLPTASAVNRGALSSTDWTTFNSKQDAITGAATTITTSNLTASRVLVSDASGKVAANAVTTTTLSYLDATSSIQTQLNAKQGTLTLTTTGTSGAATLIANTLNIPQYSGGGSASGIHTLVKPPSGGSTSVGLLGGTFAGAATIATRIYLTPYIPGQTITCSSLQINVTAVVAASNARILIYSDLSGVPNTKLYESANLDCSTLGVKTATTTQTFTAGTTYWIGVHTSSTQSYTSIPVAQLLVVYQAIGVNTYTSYIANATFGSAPATWTSSSGGSQPAPAVYITL